LRSGSPSTAPCASLTRLSVLPCLLLALGLTGCGKDQQAEPAPTTSTEAPAREVLPENVDGLDVSSLQDMAVLADGLEDRLRANVRECMAEQGFPQLIQAQQLSTTHDAQGRRDMLRIDPLETGPYTVEQARSHGMVGSALLLDKGEPGSVISRDPAFDRAQEACVERFSKRANRDVESIISQFFQLQNAARSELLQATEQRVRALLLRRLECVRDSGYPSLDPGRAVEVSSLADLLRSVGITPAEVQQQQPKEPDVKKGQVVVLAPTPPAVYSPPAEEVEFALAYVRCGEQQRFVEQLESIQAKERARVFAAHEVEVTTLGKALRDAVKATAGGS